MQYQAVSAIRRERGLADKESRGGGGGGGGIESNTDKSGDK